MGRKRSVELYHKLSTIRCPQYKFYFEQIIRGIGSGTDVALLNKFEDKLNANLLALQSDYQEQGYEFDGYSTKNPCAKDSPEAELWEITYDEYKSRYKAFVASYNSAVDTIGRKYVEQFKDRIRKISVKGYHVIGIVHDKDYVEDGDFFQPSIEKPHIHLVIWDSKDYKKPLSIQRCLNVLKLGIRFTGEDEGIVRAIAPTAHLSDFLNYLTHNTDEAIKAGKHQYDDSELFFNFDVDTLNVLRDRLVSGDSKGLKVGDVESLDDLAYNCGRSLGSFRDLYASLSPNVRINSNVKRFMTERYEMGVRDNIEQNPEVNRVCIYLTDCDLDGGNHGKSYSSYLACTQEFGKTFVVDGGKTGMFDDYDISTRCLIVNDYYTPNLLNVADNKKCKLYKRNNGTPYFCGDVLIVTCNKPFGTWLNDCNISDLKQKEAMYTRFFICHMVKIDDHFEARLQREPMTIRGDAVDKYNKFLLWINAFNRINSSYKPNSGVKLPEDIRSKIEVVTRQY